MYVDHAITNNKNKSNGFFRSSNYKRFESCRRYYLIARANVCVLLGDFLLLILKYFLFIAIAILRTISASSHAQRF